MVVCRNCGQDNPDGFRYCGACGRPLAQAALPDERRTVTVLFADLVGFTSRADRLDPEDVRRLLEPFYLRLRREVERMGGTVEKFIGDEVMAVFGMPVAHEDDAERGVRAALAIRDAVGELTGSGPLAELSVRIGVNTGEALVKPDVTPDRGERVVADFVNVAARLRAAAPVNGILVGESTYLATARAIDYEAFEPVRAKGKTEPVLAWRAVASRMRPGADPRDRGRAPLVGRERELELLSDAFARVRRERRAEVVVVAGAPGIGKTRLVLELSSVAEDDPELVWWRRGACLPYGGATFTPLAEIVKAQTAVLETDSAEDIADKLHREIAEVFDAEDEAAWVEGHLRPLLALGETRDGGDRAEAFAAWRRFLEALAEQSPLVLVFEDIHWADDGILDFIEHLADWAGAVPMLVLCTAREDLYTLRPDWEGRPHMTTIRLEPLSDDETSELLRTLLELAELPLRYEQGLATRTAGNPLYAEEFVRMLAERGSDPGSRELPVPQSVHGIIASRLDTLDLDEKRVLEDAAVFGRTFWLGAVAHLAGRAPHAVDRSLHALEAKEFVRRERRSTVDGEIELSFRHTLVRDIAYGRIPRARRAEKHRLAAEWIELLGHPEAHAETCAHHYGRALELARASGADPEAIAERARTAFADAGDRAAALGSHAVAARFYASALELWPPEQPGRALLRLRQGKALFWADESGQEALLEAREQLFAAGDRGGAAEAEMMLGKLAFRQNHGEESARRFRNALELLEGQPPSSSKAAALAALARSLHLAGETRAALPIAEQALAMAGELGLDEVRADALVTIADGHVELGEEGGLDEYEEAIALADELSSPEAITARINLADTLTELGDLTRAAATRDEAAKVAERFGDTRSLRWLAAERAGQLYFAGRWDEALLIADDFLAEVEAGRRHYQETYARVTRGRMRLARADVDGALEDAMRAVALGREAGDPQALYPALAFAARAHLAADRAVEASAFADDLLTHLASLGTAQVVYLWLHDLALVLADLGRGAELANAMAAIEKRTPWVDAGIALATGDQTLAASLYERVGARPDEAAARCRAAAAKRARGLEDDAAAELDRASRFYASVGAAAATRPAEVSALP